MLKKIFSHLFLVIAILFVLFAVIVNTGRLVAPVLDEHHGVFERWGSQILKAPIHIQHVRVRLYHFEPQIVFDHVQFTKKSGQVVKVREVGITIDAWNSLWHWTVLPDKVSVTGVRLKWVLPPSKAKKTDYLGIRDMIKSWVAESDNILLWLITQTDVSLKNVEIEINNPAGQLLRQYELQLSSQDQGAHHVLVGVLQQQVPIQTHLQFVIDSPQMSLSDTKWMGRAYLNVTHMPLNALKGVYQLPASKQTLQFDSGFLNGQVWLSFNDWEITKIQGLLQATELKGHYGSKKQAIDWRNVRTQLAWQKTVQGWSAHMGIVTINKKIPDAWPFHHIGIDHVKDSVDGQNSKNHYVLRLDRFQLATLQKDSGLIQQLGFTLPDRFHNIMPQGELQNVHVGIQKSTDQHWHVMSARALFHDIGWQDKTQLISDLSGRIQWVPSSASLAIRSHNIKIHWPSLFSQDLLLKTLTSKVKWTRQKWGSFIRLLSLKAQGAGYTVRGQGRVFFPSSPDEKSQIELLSSWHVTDMSQVQGFWPKGVLHTHLREWLMQAFPGGASNGWLVWRGPLHQYPSSPDGLLHVHVDALGMSFRYQPDWPIMTEAKGQFDMVGHRIDIHLDHAVSSGAVIDHVSASVPDLRSPVLGLTGAVHAQIPSALLFLQHTPMPWVSGLSGLSGEGPLALQLNLSIPFHDLNKLEAKGKVTLTEDDVNLSWINQTVKKLSGSFSFDNSILSSSTLTGTWRQKPISVVLATQVLADHKNLYQFFINTILQTNWIMDQYKIPTSARSTGTTPVHAIVKIRPVQKGTQIECNALTDLLGITIPAPAPYGKTSQQKKPLRLSWIYDANSQLGQGRAQYADDLTMTVQTSLSSASKGSKKTSRQVSLVADFSVIHWAKWQPYLKAFQKNWQSTTENEKAMFHKISLHMKQLRIYDHLYKNVGLTLVPGSRGWGLSVTNSEVAGNVMIPAKDKVPWTAHLTRLFLPVSSKKAWPEKNQQWKSVWQTLLQLPSMHVTIDDLRFGSRMLGSLQLVSRTLASAFDIDKLLLQTKLYRLSLTAHYTQAANGQVVMRGKVETYDLGLLLHQWHVSSSLKKGELTLEGNMTLTSLLNGLSWKTVNGQTDLTLLNGRVVNLTSGVQAGLNVGHLVNVLSLEGLPQLAKKGLVFSKITGRFLWQDGVVSTNNTNMTSSVAWMHMTGSVDCVKKLYNLHLEVIPNMTSSIPIIVGVAGGPLAGGIAWVVNKVLAKQIGKVAELHYMITGPWAHPVVKKEVVHK